jgi:hypothetical protein
VRLNSALSLHSVLRPFFGPANAPLFAGFLFGLAGKIEDERVKESEFWKGAFPWVSLVK